MFRRCEACGLQVPALARNRDLRIELATAGVPPEELLADEQWLSVSAKGLELAFCRECSKAVIAAVMHFRREEAQR